MKKNNILGENNKEQRQAIFEAQHGNQTALGALIESNTNLIVTRLKRFGITPANNNFEDFIQEGKIALMTAIETFDLSRGTAFSTYAVTKIDYSIRNCPRNRTTLSIPEEKNQQLIKYNKIFEQLSEKLGRTPTIKELSEKLNYGEIKTKRLQQLSLMGTISLDQKTHLSNNREPLTLYNIIENPRNIPFDESFNRRSLFKELLDILLESNLTDDEIIVLLLRFGIETPYNEEYTLDEISALLGLTREAVRQRERNAIDKLRNSTILLTLIEYSQNPSLLLKKIKIKRAIREKPFSEEYPDIYSYFQEYTKEEINKILNNLTETNKKLLQKINTTYTYQDSLRLYELISNVYNELISTYGRRPLISYQINTKINYQANSKDNNERLNKIYTVINIIFNPDYYKENYTFWDYLKKYDKELVKRSLMYITDDEYNLLIKRHGTSLDNLFIKYENDTNDIKDLLAIKEIIEKIEKYTLLLETNKELVPNLFVYFNKYPKGLILKSISKLSNADKTLLHKRFGPNFKTPYKELELIRLSQKEYKRLSQIIHLLEKDLLNEYNLIKAKSIIDIPQNIYTIHSQYDNNIITYAITKLGDNVRKTLYNIFGSNLNINFSELKKRSQNKEDLKKYNTNINTYIRQTLTKLNKLSIETLLDLEIKEFKKNINNFSINEVINSSNDLFEEEKEILDKSLSIGIDNISTLPNNFQLAFYGIVNRLVKKYKKKEKRSNAISTILKSYAPNPINIKNSMILFLYIGVGEVEPVPIPIISKTFDLEESKIKEIIILELNTLREKLILKNTSYNNLVKQLKAK